MFYRIRSKLHTGPYPTHQHIPHISSHCKMGVWGMDHQLKSLCGIWTVSCMCIIGLNLVSCMKKMLLSCKWVHYEHLGLMFVRKSFTKQNNSMLLGEKLAEYVFNIMQVLILILKLCLGSSQCIKQLQ